jgi:NAD-reducing hydrogenase small subunit
MSFLDLDEWLVDLAGQVEVVYGPLVDAKEYPPDVDVALVEGAVANEDNLELLRTIRRRTRTLVSFGDCAITGNVTALRNPLNGAGPVLRRAYLETAQVHPRIPAAPGVLPRLLDRVEPLHAVVPVEICLPGCPPPADRIKAVLAEVLAGRAPTSAGTSLKFG